MVAEALTQRLLNYNHLCMDFRHYLVQQIPQQKNGLGCSLSLISPK